MSDIRTYAKFPFLRGASECVAGYGANLMSLLTETEYDGARKRGMDRVIGALAEHDVGTVPLVGSDYEYKCLTETLSYVYARILVSAVNDRYLTNRYVLAEAEHMNNMLCTDSDAIHYVSEELEIIADRPEKGIIMMGITDYLRYSHYMKAIEWKLINSDVRHGSVRVDESRYSRLVQNAYRLRLEEEMPLPVPKEILEIVRDDVRFVTESVKLEKIRTNPLAGQEMRIGNLPPCISSIIESARSGSNLSHSARFALVSYLHNLGMDSEKIIAIFAESPDFDRSKSEYQIKHITGELHGREGYTPPDCSKMMTYGLCPGKDAICEDVAHPLSYYRKKAWIEKMKSERAP